MENVVYFLGAGFSAPLGLPVMSNFLSKSKDIYFLDKDKYDYFPQVFDTIAEMSVTKNYYNANLFNIEEILSILEMRNMLDTRRIPILMKRYIADVITHFTPNFNWPNNLPGNWQDFIFGKNRIHNYFGYFISNLLNLELLRYQTPNPPNDRNFDFRIMGAAEYNYSIITLNYDLLIENVVAYLNEHFCCSEIRSTHNLKATKSNKNLYLTKLHGSADSKDIIAPTWNKVIKNKYIKESWETAYHLLTEANHIRFVGYSLPITDSYIKFLFKTAIIKKRTPHLKSIDVICMDSDGSINNRFDEFIEFDNYRFKNGDFIDFLNKNFDVSSKMVSRDASSGPLISSIKFKGIESAHNDFMNT